MRSVVLLVFLLPWTAFAAPVDLSLSGYGSFYRSEDYDEGYGGGAKLKVEVLDYLAADARVSYVTFAGGDVKMLPVELTVMLQLPLLDKLIVPYAGIGVGYYTFPSSGVKLDNEFGVGPVLGAEMRLGKNRQFGLFAEARWLYLRPEFRNSVGTADLSGVGVNLGLSFHFW